MIVLLRKSRHLALRNYSQIINGLFIVKCTGQMMFFTKYSPCGRYLKSGIAVVFMIERPDRSCYLTYLNNCKIHYGQYEEVPISCIKKLFPTTKWRQDECISWPK
jgi:hypothetical protein